MDDRLRSDRAWFRLGLAGALLRAVSTFIPIEGGMSGWQMASGYDVGPARYPMRGWWFVAVFEVAPFILGIAILAALALRGRPRVAFGLLSAYAAVWVAGGVRFAWMLAETPGLWFARLWVGAIAAGEVLVAAVLAWAVRKTIPQPAWRMIGLALALCAIGQMAGSMAFAVMEDGVGLDVGGLTGPAGAAGLVVAMCRLRDA